MQTERAMAVAKKDMQEVFSSISIYGPMLGVPLFFAILLPVLTFYVAMYAAPSLATRIIPQVAASGTNVKSAAFMAFFSVNVLGPIFLTMPILTASVIAADSFAGEKERKTSEALLATPITKAELMIGKILASFIPTILLTLAVFAIYGSVTDFLSNKAFGVLVLPTPPWFMMLLTAPLLAIATIGIVVIVSAHAKGIKEAQQISTLLVLPILMMPFIAIMNIANMNVVFFAYLIAFLAAASIIILYVGVKWFRKEAIL
ncbi:MAG: ABC transporter permease subunit [Candidatus Micrarchaeia archaeon]